MSRSLACVLLLCTSSAHAAWTQIDPPADTSGWAEITIAPAFSDTVPLILSVAMSGGPEFFLQTNHFWLDFNFRPDFLMNHQRLGFLIAARINLEPEADASVSAVTVERLGDVFSVGSPNNTFQQFRYTSAAGIREVTLSVGRAVPEPSDVALVATTALGLIAARRRHGK